MTTPPAAEPLGLATDALVHATVTTRTREGDRTVLDSPSARDFWFGHGYALDAPPGQARLEAQIAEGRARFGAAGARRFVVQWERPYGTPPPPLAVPAHTEYEPGIIVLAYAGPPAQPDARALDHDDDGWAEAAELFAAEYPDQADFYRRRLRVLRADVAAGRARAIGIRAEDRLLAHAALYRGEGLARFATPLTSPAARGRGLFTACARTLIAWANADAPRRVAIAAAADGPLPLYLRLGFVPVSLQDAVVVTLGTSCNSPGSHGGSS